ncbi:hypothetical protein BY458DRAFT_520567 [Sporodiniella umbellata]|nr:hypothetical protein BY458DRAFT_520567 [Sporodiniella umbellata]
MKSSLLIAAGVLSTASQVFGAINVITPWSTSVWTAGGNGNITWTATAPENALNCDIQLMSGDPKNQNIVAQITSPTTPIPCSAGKYDIHPINDFASGPYSIRIGQASTGTWAYSGSFTLNGTGAAKPISVVSAATAAASGSVAPAASSGASSVPIGKAAASGSISASASGSKSLSASATATPNAGASTTGTLHVAAIALGAVAATAFAL